MELDAAAGQVIFSATGIGGSSIALDASGNIYLAGSSPGTDYPTTPGAYQTALVQGHLACPVVCIDNDGAKGNLQHVTKVDPAASRLIYSTGLNDPTGAAGSTTNTGLAIDPVGNAYLTGTLLEAQYPFTTAPDNSSLYSPSGYLTKLDPAGAKVLFSIPVGGAGVQLDSSGAVYVGGVVSTYSPPHDLSILVTAPLAPPPVFSWIPRQCWPDNLTAISEAYVLKVDPATGNVLDGQWIDGSAPGATAIALAAGTVWITGPTPGPDVPFSPGVLAPPNLGPGFLAGAYLAAADFSAGVHTRAGDRMRVGWRQPDPRRTGGGIPGALPLRHESGTGCRGCAGWNRFLRRGRIHYVRWRSRAVAVRLRIADRRGGSGAAAPGNSHATDGERCDPPAPVSLHRVQPECVRHSVLGRG